MVYLLTGLPDNFTVQAFVILFSGGIFCLSSWIGINNGLQRLSKMVGWGAFLLPLLVLIVGPTEFITNNIINAIGLTTQNFLQMSLFTDPLGNGEFTRNWTVFYWLWWISYTWRGNVCHSRIPWSQNQRGYLGVNLR